MHARTNHVQHSVLFLNKARYNEDVVSRNRLAIKIGVGVSFGILLGIGACRLTQTRQLGYGFLRNGEIVYSGAGQDGHNRVRTTETVVNVPSVATRTIDLVQQELPSAIRRLEDDGTVSFVLPQFENGRMQITEYPEQAIQVKPGRVVRQGSKLFVMNEANTLWSHVEIKDFRQPSALESAMTWIGDRFGI